MTAENSNIEVAVALPIYHTFTYSVPSSLMPFAATGKRVLVPFGQRRVTGYIVGSAKDTDAAEIKHILDVLDEQTLFPSELIPFFKWISDYYKHPIGDVIKNALPGGLTLYDYASLSITEQGQTALKSTTLTSLQRAVLELLASGPCRLQRLNDQLGQHVPGALVHSLQRSGWISKTRELKAASTKSRTERYVALAESMPSADRLSKARQKIIDTLARKSEISMPELRRHVPSASRLVRDRIGRSARAGGDGIRHDPCVPAAMRT